MTLNRKSSILFEDKFINLRKGPEKASSSTEKKEVIPTHINQASKEIYKNFIIDIVKKNLDKKIMSKHIKPSVKTSILRKWIVDNYLYPRGYVEKKNSSSTVPVDPLDFSDMDKPKAKKTLIDTFTKKNAPNINLKSLTKLVDTKIFGNRNETLNKIKAVRKVIEIQEAKSPDGIATTPAQAKEIRKYNVASKIKQGLQNLAYKLLNWNNLSNPMSSRKQQEIAKAIQTAANEFLYKRGLYIEISAKGQLSTKVYYLNGDRYWKYRRSLRNTGKIMRTLSSYIKGNKKMIAAIRMPETKNRPTQVASR